MSRIRLNEILWFLRPTIGVLICYVIAMSISYSMSQKRIDELNQQLDEVAALADEVSDLRRPSPDLTPKQVVSIQTSALQNEDRQRGTLQCACFASPQNFAVTGPIERFGRIVRGAKFRILSQPKAIAIGDPIFRENSARVLVTAFDGHKAIAFVWVLEKQMNGPMTGCWMTDGVFPTRRDSSQNGNEI